jgi:tetratricopeptide (TPR) repeat protein
MRSRRWPHALALLAGVASAQGSGAPVQPDDQSGAPAPSASPAATAATPTTGEAAIPDHAPGPAKIAVTPFENHVPNGKSFDWVVAEAPFEIAEKAENVLGLDAVNAPLYVPGERVPAESDTVADFGNKHGAKLVVTGWFDRIGDQFRIAVLVWKVEGKGKSTVAGEAQRMGAMPTYHELLGDAAAEAWSEAGVAVDAGKAERLTRTLSKDIYPVFMMGRGLGHYSGALAAMSSIFGTGSGSGSGPPAGPDLDSAKHDLERAVFLDPKLFEAQRLLGELYMATAAGDQKLIAKATGKLTYAADLAPDDAPSLRAAAFAMARAGKAEVALDLFKKLLRRNPWDLDARYELGAAMWHVGDARDAEKQLVQVTSKLPDHLPARRVLVLIHASRSDTKKLIAELEAIAVRAPDDLEVKADLATAYGSIGEWEKAIANLEAIAKVRPNDLALLVRIGDAERKAKSLDKALAWYARANRVAPESSLPGYSAAQAQFEAGRLAEAYRAYTNLQKYTADRAVAEHALGVIAYLQGRADEAAWYLRQATRNAPRSLVTRRAVIAAELTRKDAPAALAQLAPALAAWPNDATLHYLAGIAYHLAGDNETARAELTAAAPGYAAAEAALSLLGTGGNIALEFKPELVRLWGDGDVLQAKVDHFGEIAAQMAKARADYQKDFLGLIGALGSGPSATVKRGSVKTCPVGRLAPLWDSAQKTLQRYIRLGGELEADYRFIARHDDLGLTQSLLPNARTQVAKAKKSYRVSLADVGELRAEWTRGLGPELRAAGCTDKLLAAAVKDPQRYKVIVEDKPEPLPVRQPPRPKPRATFYVDNTRCADPVEVWIDGTHIGQVAPGRRSALVADGGERTLCLLLPGGAQCGDRGTVRQVYLHDGWSTTLHCPK